MAKAKLPDKTKTIVLAAVLVLSVVWIGYFASKFMGGPGSFRELNTPGWNIAKEINAHLTTTEIYKDVGVDVVNENPLTVKVVGLVHVSNAMDGLKQMLAEKWPNVNFEYEVAEMP